MRLNLDAKDTPCTCIELSEGTTAGQIFGIELVISFVLVMTVFATCDSLRSEFGELGPLAIGLSVSMCHLWAVRIHTTIP